MHDPGDRPSQRVDKRATVSKTEVFSYFVIKILMSKGSEAQ